MFIFGSSVNTIIVFSKSTYPNIFSPSPDAWLKLHVIKCPHPPCFGVPVRSYSLLSHWHIEKLIPGDLSIRFSYICKSFSHGRYKVSHRIRYAARLTTLRESARLITYFGHQLLASAHVASAWLHLAWVESRSANHWKNLEGVYGIPHHY